MRIDEFEKGLTMTGSPPQVKWALSVRKKAANELQTMGEIGCAKILRPYLNNEKLARLGFVDIDDRSQLVSILNGLMIDVVRETNATKWIESRDKTIHKRLEESLKAKLKQS